MQIGGCGGNVAIFVGFLHERSGVPWYAGDMTESGEASIMDFSPAGRVSKWKTLRRWVGWPLAIILLGAAIVLAAREADWQAAARADPMLMLKLLVAVLGSLYFTGLIYRWITRLFELDERPVGFFEMQAIIAASTLLNFLPFKAGLVGRAVYLKRVHGIGYRASMVSFFTIFVISILVYGYLLGTVLFFGTLGQTDLLDSGGAMEATLVVGFAVMVIVGGLILPTLLSHAQPDEVARPIEAYAWWERSVWLLKGLIIRGIDAAIMSARVYFAFLILGVTISPSEAIILATAGMFLAMLGITPNGLGLREWLYGLIAASGFFGGDVATGLQLGISAALIDRAAEILIFTPAGLISIAWLRRRLRAVELYPAHA